MALRENSLELGRRPVAWHGVDLGADGWRPAKKKRHAHGMHMTCSGAWERDKSSWRRGSCCWTLLLEAEGDPLKHGGIHGSGKLSAGESNVHCRIVACESGRPAGASLG